VIFPLKQNGINDFPANIRALLVRGGYLSYKVFAHVVFVRHICRKNAINRIMTIFEERIFRELLEIVRSSPINYDIMDLKAF
jgi:hypothetical protein